jgi:predicted ester cyclase
MSDQNKRVLRRLFDEVINGRNFAVIDELFAPDYVNHGPFQPDRGEFAGLKPTGRRVEVTEINIPRFRDGLMVEHWALLDEASMMRQLAGR